MVDAPDTLYVAVEDNELDGQLLDGPFRDEDVAEERWGDVEDMEIVPYAEVSE